MTSLKAALVVAALSAGSGVAAAQTGEWRHIGQDGPVEVAVDIASFSGPQSRRTVRSILVPMSAGDGFDYLIVDATIDCEARTITGVSISAHDPQGLLLGRRDLPPESAAVKESDGTAALADASCDGVELTGRSFTSVAAFTAWANVPAADR